MPAAAYICGRWMQCASCCCQTSGMSVCRLAAVSPEFCNHQSSRFVLSSLRNAMMILWPGRSDCHANSISICVMALYALEFLIRVCSEHGLLFFFVVFCVFLVFLLYNQTRSWQCVSVMMRNYLRFFFHSYIKMNIRSICNSANLFA